MFSLNVVISGPAFMVKLCQAGPFLRIGDHHEVPSLKVGPGGRLEGDFDAPLDYLRLHRAGQVQALTYTAGCGKEMVHGGQIHVSASLMLAKIGNPV